MNKFIHHIFLFLTITMFVRCQNDNNSKQKENTSQKIEVGNEMVGDGNWLSFSVGKKQFISHKLTIQKGVLSFSVYEIPQAYFLKNNKSKVDKNERIFIFEIKSNSHKRVNEHCNVVGMSNSSLIEYLSFKMENDVYMKRKSDTTYSLGMIYEPSFGVAPIEKFIFFIQDSLKNVPFNIVYQDHLFGTGISSFELNKNLKLKLNNNYDI